MANFWNPLRWFGNNEIGAPVRNEGEQVSVPFSTNGMNAKAVGFDNAMQISAVWAAVRLLSETVASLPFELYRVKDGIKTKADNHPLYDLLRYRPNRYQTNVEFWESVVLNLTTSGNSYCLIERLGANIVSLLPVSSDQMRTVLLPDGSIIYEYIYNGNVKVYAPESVWHIKLFGNGVTGLSPLAYAAQSIGIAVGADNRVSDIYSNGAKPSGILTIDRVLKEDQRAQIKKNFAELSEGKQDRLFVLEAGMQYSQISMSPSDIELLDSRRFQIEDIGRFFGVPSILLNQTFGQSSLGSNVYEIISGFYKLNLRPFLEKIEASVVRWLVQDKNYEAEFDFDLLLGLDRLKLAQAGREEINSAQSTPNEIRALKGLPPVEGGDKLYIQGATVPLELAGTLGKFGGSENANQTTDS